MQAKETVTLAHTSKVLDAIFADEAVVYEADSSFQQHTRQFTDHATLAAYVEEQRSAGKRFLAVAVHYRQALGQVQTKTVTLSPEKCAGATWRESVHGWGLIHLQLSFEGNDSVELRITVNTEKRAEAWVSAYPEMGAPAQWNWKLVEKHARRLIRVLRNAT